jgi:glycerophosphoryl diester phosphodiesterase
MLFLSLLSVAAQIEVHGHRGARMVLPENTLPGFEYAIREGADFIEIDTWVTKDNVVVVAHDPLMNLAHCKGPVEGAERTIRKMTLAELRKWDCGVANPAWPKQKAVPGTPAPTLDEVLALTRKYKNFKINLEIKSDPRKPELQPSPDEYAQMVWDAIRKHKAEKRVLIQSFDFAPLRSMKKIVPATVPISALYPGSAQDSQRDFVAVSKDAGGTPSVSIHQAAVTAEKVEQAHQAKIRVRAWTANKAEEWDKLIAAKVDGIITDDPAALIAHLKSRNLRR